MSQAVVLKLCVSTPDSTDGLPEQWINWRIKDRLEWELGQGRKFKDCGYIIRSSDWGPQSDAVDEDEEEEVKDDEEDSKEDENDKEEAEDDNNHIIKCHTFSELQAQANLNDDDDDDNENKDEDEKEEVKEDKDDNEVHRKENNDDNNQLPKINPNSENYSTFR